MYNLWDVAYRYELDGEIIHSICESFEDEYGYYPVDFWVDDPQYSYPDGEINVIGIENSDYLLEDGVEIIDPEVIAN